LFKEQERNRLALEQSHQLELDPILLFYPRFFPKPAFYLHKEERCTQRLRAQLRLDVARLNWPLWRRSLVKSPYCPICFFRDYDVHLWQGDFDPGRTHSLLDYGSRLFRSDIAETREHVLLSCPAYDLARSQLLSYLLSLPNAQLDHGSLTLVSILDPRSPSTLAFTGSFIREIKSIRDAWTSRYDSHLKMRLL